MVGGALLAKHIARKMEHVRYVLFKILRRIVRFVSKSWENRILYSYVSCTKYAHHATTIRIEAALYVEPGNASKQHNGYFDYIFFSAICTCFADLRMFVS